MHCYATTLCNSRKTRWYSFTNALDQYRNTARNAAAVLWRTVAPVDIVEAVVDMANPAAAASMLPIAAAYHKAGSIASDAAALSESTVAVAVVYNTVFAQY